jgi:hypothetical protein
MHDRNEAIIKALSKKLLSLERTMPANLKNGAVAVLLEPVYRMLRKEKIRLASSRIAGARLQQPVFSQPL